MSAFISDVCKMLNQQKKEHFFLACISFWDLSEPDWVYIFIAVPACSHSHQASFLKAANKVLAALSQAQKYHPKYTLDPPSPFWEQPGSTTMCSQTQKDGLHLFFNICQIKFHTRNIAQVLLVESKI